jgi:D-glycero-D-manno-heptose 1,7-bisphosphate phosphatase
MTIKLAVLDRDNTINYMPPEKRYLYGNDPIQLLRTTGKAIQILNQRSIKAVVASNQQGIALAEYPQMTCASVDLYNQRLNTCLMEVGAHIDRFYICPHRDADNCTCRKPKPGLILRALEEYEILPSEAVMIGNNQSDMDAGLAAGVRTIAVPYPPNTAIRPDVPSFPTLLQAVKAILK